MGISSSRPPAPLVEVGNAQTKILVPADSIFTVLGRQPRGQHPHGSAPHRKPSRRSFSPGSTNFTDDKSSAAEGTRLRGRHRRRTGARLGYAADTDSEGAMSAFGGRRPLRGGGGGGGGMPTGAGAARDYFGGYGGNAAEMGYAGMSAMPGAGGRPMGMGIGTGLPMGGRGFAGAVGGDVGAYPYAQQGMGTARMDMGGVPMARQGSIGGMMGAPQQAGMPVAAADVSLHQPPPQPVQQPHAPGMAVPMGGYAMQAQAPSPGSVVTSPTPQARDPTPAERVNRWRPTENRAGPNGDEWIRGDSFLDACMCTAKCTCRSGFRTLYRHRRKDGGKEEGEIRYILKDRRDCDDHTNCFSGGQSRGRGGGEGSRRENSGGKRGFETESREQGMKNLKKDVRGLGEDVRGLAEMVRDMKMGSESPMRGQEARLAAMGGLPGGGMNSVNPAFGGAVDHKMAGMLSSPMGIDPRLAMNLGVQMPGEMGGMAGLPPMARQMSDSRMGFGGGDMPPYLGSMDSVERFEAGEMEAGMMDTEATRGLHGMPAGFGRPGRKRRGGGVPRGLRDMDMIGGNPYVSPFSLRSGGRRRGPDRRQLLGRRRPNFSEAEDLYIGMGAARGVYEDPEFDDFADPDFDDEEGGRRRRSAPGRGGTGRRGRPASKHMESRGKQGRQAHVEDGDDDI